MWFSFLCCNLFCSLCLCFINNFLSLLTHSGIFSPFSFSLELRNIKMCLRMFYLPPNHYLCPKIVIPFISIYISTFNPLYFIIQTYWIILVVVLISKNFWVFSALFFMVSYLILFLSGSVFHLSFTLLVLLKYLLILNFPFIITKEELGGLYRKAGLGFHTGTRV